MIAVQFVIADSKSTYLKKSHITIMHYKNWHCIYKPRVHIVDHDAILLGTVYSNLYGTPLSSHLSGSRMQLGRSHIFKGFSAHNDLIMWIHRSFIVCVHCNYTWVFIFGEGDLLWWLNSLFCMLLCLLTAVNSVPLLIQCSHSVLFNNVVSSLLMSTVKCYNYVHNASLSSLNS